MFCKSISTTIFCFILLFNSAAQVQAQTQEYALFNLSGDYGRSDRETPLNREEVYTYGDAFERSSLQALAATTATGVSALFVQRLTNPVERVVPRNSASLNAIPESVRHFMAVYGMNSPLGAAFNRNAGQIQVFDQRGQLVSAYQFAVSDGRSEDLTRAYVGAIEAAERLGENSEIRLSLRTEGRLENVARRFGRNPVLQVFSASSLGLLYVGTGAVTYRLFTDTNGVACLRAATPGATTARVRGQLEAQCQPTSWLTSILFGVDYQGILPAIR